jgi:hypothetical protein
LLLVQCVDRQHGGVASGYRAIKRNASRDPREAPWLEKLRDAVMQAWPLTWNARCRRPGARDQT